MNKPVLSTLALAVLSAVAPAQADDQSIERILVTGDFRQLALQDLSESVTVLSAEELEARQTRALEEALLLVPNVNLSAGASRGRFIQIRGIGERSEFAQPLNPSVGLLVDGFDFSGLGLAGVIHDIQQVEVFRGPQGTRFGANALAGMVNIQTREPVPGFEGHVGALVANEDTWQLRGAVAGGSETLSARLSASKFASDGFNHNAFLDKPTQTKDESAARLKLAWQASDELRLELLGLTLDVDNGYDAFSFDNSRTTLSDQPGGDKQQSDGLGIRAHFDGLPFAKVELTASRADSDLEYFYDEDWSNPGYCQSRDCPWGDYSGFDRYLRDKESRNLDLRLLSKPDSRLGDSDWVLGLYGRWTDDKLQRQYTWLDADFFSVFDNDYRAVYGQLDTPIGNWRLTTGLRLERWEAEYVDSNGVTFSPSEDLWGANLNLGYDAGDRLYFVGLSRGYKPGGFNIEGSLPSELRTFDTETLVNLEAGMKWLVGGDLRLQLTAFHMWRDDMQVKSGYTQTRDDGSTEFVDYWGNAASGRNYGLELEGDWRATEQLTLSAVLGWLETEYKDFTNAAGERLDGRDQAHAPNWQYHLAATWQFNDALSLRLESEGRDGFYFSDSHDERSWSYALWHAALNWQQGNWELSLYGKNLFDRDYAVRGFGGFGNDPAKSYAVEPYWQLGDGREVGISGTYRF
ncbi:TonB-dependent receptor plug domain-containing protein [Gallaecimonas sp. GXIMD4217]|uniref:TonB-dependent receptor n=1 Tax=Gallaecimonas sp. GXIMD4217 TaxID=3131927 RepID=UPI00311B0F09